MKKYILYLLFFAFIIDIQAQRPNFTEDIAPIIYNHCSTCHREGEIGPMLLTNYQQVSNWANMIKYVTEIRYMPPWKADPAYASFMGENYLTDMEINLIAEWVDNGKPQGDPALEPPLPAFSEGSLLGEPDLVLSFEEAFHHKGNNQDEYRVFVLPTRLTENKELAAIELRPGNKQVVHHALFSSDTTGKARKLDAEDPGYGYDGFGGFGIVEAFFNQYPGYVPGQIPRFFPDGIGQKLEAGSDLLVQMHYAPVSVDAWDSSSVNLFFKKEPVKRYLETEIMLPLPRVLTNGPFVIPPNRVKRFHGVWTVPKDISLISITPHMHLLGKDWEVFAVSPKGDTTKLIRISDWDFNWQGTFQYDRFIKLEKGTKVHAYATYDNTTNNPENPNNPPKVVTWGERTTDEMYYLPISYVEYQEGDENVNLTTSAMEELVEWPKNRILNAFPNPTSDEITVGFSLADNQKISISLSQIDSKRVKKIVENRFYPVGHHKHTFDMSDLSEGIYLLTVKGKYFSDAKRIILE